MNFVVVSILLIGNVRSVKSFELDTFETHNLKLLYIDPLQTYLVPHTARSFHNSLKFQRYIFDWTPYDEQTIVLLKDFSDYGNAAATATPRNMVLMDVAPRSHTFETLYGSERIYSSMNHEMVHVANLDAWNEQDRKWRHFFGGKPFATSKHPESILYFYLATPRMVTPGWFYEGAATFMQTWMNGGLGRAQGAYDEMVFRSMVRDEAHFYSALGLVSQGTRIDFQVGANAYLYGTRFMSYLAMEYAPQKVVEWLKRDEGSKRYYANQFEHVFEKPLEDVWDDWIAWEHEFQIANLESVRQFPLTATSTLTKQRAGSISRSFHDPQNNIMVGAFRTPGIVAHIGVLSLDDGSIERITDIKGPMLYGVSSTAYDPKSKTVFFTTDNYAFRDLMSVDLITRKDRMLLEDARIGDIVFDKTRQSLWGLRHLNGYVTLVQIPYPYDSWSQVYTWPYGTVPFEIDISPDGELMSMSMGELDGQQYLRVFRVQDLLDKNLQPMAEFDFGTAIPEGFVFTTDGNYLYGSSYLTGVSNIFRYNLLTGDIDAVSNAETGFFRPIPMEDGLLIVFEYTGQGFVPVIIDPVLLEDVGAITFLGAEIANKHPIVKEWRVGSPADVDIDSLITHKGKYLPFREMEFDTAYPVIEGYKDYAAVGYNFSWSDPAQFYHIYATASYSWNDNLSSSEKLHVNVQYETLDWTFRYWHNDADFYDLFGPKKRSRKGDAFIVRYQRSLIFDLPRRMDLDIGVAYYTGLDTLPGNQNVPFQFDKLFSMRGELSYEHTRKSLGAVDHEKGFRWDVVGYLDNTNDDTIPKLRAGFDFGFALPLKHSSIWFYNSAGITGGDRRNPLAQWYFGAFGNNYVDDGEVKRYREYDSFPGFDFDDIFGQDFAKTMLEWNLPPYIFREVGTPSFYLTWMRPSIFAGYLITDIGDRREETYGSLGAQLDFRFTVIHRLPMTFSVSYAQGYIDGKKFDTEWLLSLKIL